MHLVGSNNSLAHPAIDDITASLQLLELQEQKCLQLRRWIQEQDRRRARRSLLRLPDDVTVRMLSYCDFKTNREVSLVSHRMCALSQEQLESAAEISFRNERAELSSMYPETSRIWPSGARRNFFFDQLEINEQETLAFFDRALVHLAPIISSPNMRAVKKWMATRYQGSEKLPHGLVPRKPCQKLALIAYNVVFKCESWRKWVSRAIRIVQCLFSGGKEHDPQVASFLGYAPPMSLLIIRFMSLYTERVHLLTNFDNLLKPDVASWPSNARAHYHLAFENWMLQCGQTTFSSEKQGFEAYLLAAALSADSAVVGSLGDYHLVCKTFNVQAAERIGKFAARFPLVRFDKRITKRLSESFTNKALSEDLVAIYLELERGEQAGELEEVFKYVARESWDRLERPLPLGRWYHFGRLEEGFKHVPGRNDKQIRSWYKLPSEDGSEYAPVFDLVGSKAWFITHGFVAGMKVLLPS